MSEERVAQPIPPRKGENCVPPVGDPLWVVLHRRDNGYVRYPFTDIGGWPLVAQKEVDGWLVAIMGLSVYLFEGVHAK